MNVHIGSDDASLVTHTISGHNVYLLEIPLGIILITTDSISIDEGGRPASVVMFTREQWKTLRLATPEKVIAEETSQ